MQYCSIISSVLSHKFMYDMIARAECWLFEAFCFLDSTLMFLKCSRILFETAVCFVHQYSVARKRHFNVAASFHCLSGVFHRNWY